MAALTVEMRTIEEQIIYGVWGKSNDKTISKDIKTLSGQYHLAVNKPEGSVLPYYVLSRNYDEQSRAFELFIGSTMDREGLEKVTLPAGEYAGITVRPKLGFLWGVSVGEAKRYFYTRWLPESPYLALNMEYEYHTEKSMGKYPEITIVFAIKKKG